MWSPSSLGGADLVPTGRTKHTSTAAALFGMAGLLCASGARPARAEVEFESVVTAPSDPDSKPREDDAAAASVITRDRTPRSAESLPQLLSELPGVSITRLGALGSLGLISIRGSTPNQVQVYVDGVPLGTASATTVDLGLIPINDAERIEVYRGTTPIGFGASALGGIVSLTTIVPESSRLGAQIGAGSFGTRFGGAQGQWVGPGVRVLGAANFLGSAGDFPYSNDRGSLFEPTDDAREMRRQNNRLRQADGVLRASIPLPGRRDLLASLSFFDRWQGVPAMGMKASYQASLTTRRLIGSLAYDSHGELGPGGRLRAQVYTVVTEQRFVDELKEIAYRETHTRDRTDVGGGTVTLKRVFVPWLSASATANVQYESFRPTDEWAGGATPVAGAPGTRAFAAAGAEADVWARRLDLDVIPSLRLELAHDEISGRDLLSGTAAAVNRPQSYALPIARLGLIQRPASFLALRANVGRYARLPSLLERYGNDGRFQGNPDLVPESGVNADVGAALTLAGDAGSAVIQLGAFGALVDDLIQFQKGENVLRALNIGKARILGAELSAEGRAGRHGRLYLQGTFTDSRDVSGASASDGRQLPHCPRLRAYARPEMRGWRLGGWGELGVYGDVDVTGGNYIDPANFARLPARILLGAGGYVASRRSGLRAVLSGQNLGDSRVNDVANFPLPGRSIFVSLQWSHKPDNPRQETLP